MAHHHQNWGVQIGPKVDSGGTHVAVYAWRDCDDTYHNCAWWFFQPYQALTPGSIHNYSVTWTPNGWALSADGQVLVTLNPGSADPIYEQGSEHTAS